MGRVSSRARGWCRWAVASSLALAGCQSQSTTVDPFAAFRPETSATELADAGAGSSVPQSPSRTVLLTGDERAPIASRAGAGELARRAPLRAADDVSGRSTPATRGLADAENRQARTRETDDDSHAVEKWLQVARMAQERGREDLATQAYSKAVQRFPSSADAWNDLGQFRMSQEKLPEALQAFRMAAELDPGSTLYQNNLGVALLRSGSTLQGVERLQGAVGEAAGHYNAGVVLEQMGDHARAVEQFRIALAKDPNLSAAATALRQPTRRNARQPFREPEGARSSGPVATNDSPRISNYPSDRVEQNARNVWSLTPQTTDEKVTPPAGAAKPRRKLFSRFRRQEQAPVYPTSATATP